MKNILVSLITLCAAVSFAKDDLANRLGVGYSNQTVADVPSLAVHYYPSTDLGLTGSVGVDTEKDNSKFVLTAGLRKIIFKEQNLNFYAGGSVGLVNYEVNDKSKNGTELNGHFGVEFFFAGLDSLGFNVESGIAISSVENTRFRTYGDSPIRAGIFFYF